ncbi:MAG: ribulose-phosphate 3-epimerase [Thermoleophilia bacterium]|nr:ribulose-phosphate 3-epimerase [Thermoleophilia bacterium]
MPWRDWIRTVEVEPSIYGADFARLGEQLEDLLRAECRVFHFDVGDGHFVDPITMGPIVLQSISPLIHGYGGVIDVHLMVDNPTKHFRAVAEAGGDSVTFHVEAVADVAATIRAAREQELQVGVAFNPETAPDHAAAVAGAADIVLCMGIHPGYSGQPFLEETFDRVEELRGLLPDETPIQVDGGVGPGNIRELRNRGATLFVAASAIFGREDLPRSYRRLVQDLT